MFVVFWNNQNFEEAVERVILPYLLQGNSSLAFGENGERRMFTALRHSVF